MLITASVVCVAITAVFYFYHPVREATVNQLDALANTQRMEGLAAVDFWDRQFVSGAEAKQICVRYQNSNIVHVPAVSSIADLGGIYLVSVNYSVEPVIVEFTPAASSNLH